MTKLEELLDKLNRGLEMNNLKLNDKNSNKIQKNRASYNIPLLETFRNITLEALKEQKFLIDKCKKWDDLEEKIARFYPEGSDDNEFDEYDEGLIEIGEITAKALGYL